MKGGAVVSQDDLNRDSDAALDDDMDDIDMSRQEQPSLHTDLNEEDDLKTM